MTAGVIGTAVSDDLYTWTLEAPMTEPGAGFGAARGDGDRSHRRRAVPGLQLPRRRSLCRAPCDRYDRRGLDGATRSGPRPWDPREAHLLVGHDLYVGRVVETRDGAPPCSSPSATSTTRAASSARSSIPFRSDWWKESHASSTADSGHRSGRHRPVARRGQRTTGNLTIRSPQRTRPVVGTKATRASGCAPGLFRMNVRTDPVQVNGKDSPSVSRTTTRPTPRHRSAIPSPNPSGCSGS